MVEPKKIIDFEVAINHNNSLIKKKKKSARYVFTIILLIYVVVFNLRSSFLSSYFENQFEYIKVSSIVFVLIIVVYLISVVYQVLKLSKQVKIWNNMYFKLSKLEKEVHN